MMLTSDKLFLQAQNISLQGSVKGWPNNSGVRLLTTKSHVQTPLQILRFGQPDCIIMPHALVLGALNVHPATNLQSKFIYGSGIPRTS